MKYLPNRQQTAKNSETREEFTPLIREKKTAQVAVFDRLQEPEGSQETESAKPKEIPRCPYCSGKDVVRRGTRKKKYELQQRYLCNHCQRSFVPQKVKGWSFPLRVILEGLSLYNTGFNLQQTCRLLQGKYGIEVKDATLSDWVKEFESTCRYNRLRPYGLKLYSPHQVIQTVHLYHRQVYDFSVHRAKLALLLQDYKYGKFDNLREFLEAVQGECPHQFFQDGERISEQKVDFSLDEVILRRKDNFANRIAELVLQAVSDNKARHKSLQKFMLCNDSVTVAVEVPVYMDKWDIKHMQDRLGFRIPIDWDNIEKSRQRQASTAGSTSAKVLTGHIDILQLRNGAVHILDYKPDAARGKRSATVNQLTLYALALSRLTGLRLFDFKCACPVRSKAPKAAAAPSVRTSNGAWFDEQDYFEFFPLHVVYKLRERQKKDSPEQLKFTNLLEGEDGQCNFGLDIQKEQFPGEKTHSQLP